MSSKKKIAIVGGGFAGIISICFLQEEGIDSICFEKTDRPGGTWNYREETELGVPSIMPTTIINHSKEMGALSTVPPPKELNNFLRHHELFKFFMNTVQEKDALKHIRLNSEVLNVKKSSDYDETGRWIVAVKNTISGNITEDVYDGVLMCVGQFNRPKWPSYDDQELFKGKIMHTHSLKGVMPYQNKRVIVVGMGCSALDAAVEISHVAKQVYLSTRSGAHVFSRIGPRGLPFDYALLRRYITIMLDFSPNLASWLVENFLLDPKFNSKLYKVQPKYHVFSKDPIINDHLASKLLSGLVIQKPDIMKFTEKGVIFEGETTVIEADVVIMATGYTWKFPVSERDVQVEDEDKINLYKCMWPPHLKHPTLAFIGFFLPFGPGFPIGEMQVRWATQVFSGNIKLPSTEEMLKDIEEKHMKNVARYGPSAKQTVRVDYVQYLDELANQFGAKPNFLKIFFTDPQLFFKLIFGPSLPYQYRLQGPHPWSGAREAIMTSEERVLYPLKQTKMVKLESQYLVFIKKILTLLLPFF